MSLKDRAANLFRDKSLLGLYRLFGGLSEFWAFVFGVSAIVLAFKGKLDGNFAATITAVTGILTLHDSLDDWHSRKVREQDHQQVNAVSPDGIPSTNEKRASGL